MSGEVEMAGFELEVFKYPPRHENHGISTIK